MATLVGADGGGSHTEVAVATESLTPVARQRGGPGSVKRGAEADAAERLATCILAAHAAAGLPGGIDVLVVGTAGAGDDDVASRLRSELAARVEAGVIEVATDVEIAAWSAFPEGEGIVLSAGTGSIALGLTTEGTTVRAGGYGWRFGDDGSGYAIGRAAINAVLRALDGRGPPSRLTAIIGADSGAGASPRPWLDRLTPQATAALVADVARAADEGDAVARDILGRAAADLVDHVEAVGARLDAPPGFPVAFNGGLLAPELPVRDLVRAEIARRGLRFTLREQAPDPVLGALHRAARLRTERGS